MIEGLLPGGGGRIGVKHRSKSGSKRSSDGEVIIPLSCTFDFGKGGGDCWTGISLIYGIK
jgi:hypothetical protein